MKKEMDFHSSNSGFGLSLTLHILSTIIVICLSVKMGFEAAAEDEDEAAAGPAVEEADMAAEAARITEASSIIGSGEDGGEDLSPEEHKEVSKISVLFP